MLWLTIYVSGVSLAFGPFNGFDHDSTCVKLIRLEEKLTDKLDFSSGDLLKKLLPASGTNL